jgi:carbon-monoxide dehydrogenase large subunit
LHDIRQSLLAIDKVRHVGEAVAVIVATSRYAAEDAAELAVVNVSPLPAVVKPEKGLEAGAALVHEQCETNLIGEYSFVKGDVDAALARSPHRIERRIYNHRYSAIPMEGRGVVSAHDVRTNMLTVWASTQMAHWVGGMSRRHLGCRNRRCAAWHSMSEAVSELRVTYTRRISSFHFSRASSADP